MTDRVGYDAGAADISWRLPGPIFAVFAVVGLG
jgi:hypothetical protein